MEAWSWETFAPLGAIELDQFQDERLDAEGYQGNQANGIFRPKGKLLI